MRIFHFVLILAVSILLKNVYCDSSNPLPNTPLSSLPKTKASPKQFFFRKNIGWEGRDEFLFFLTHEISNKYTNGLRPRGARTLSGPLLAPSPPPRVTSYILAVQWPPGVCCVQNSGVTCKINPVPTEFTIHSLRPEPNGAPSTEKFDAKKIATLTSQLNTNWPNLKSALQSVSENEKLWKEEWDSRGKYSGLGVHAYFEKTLDLFKNSGQGLYAKLAAEKITPIISNTYKLKDIEAAVKKINGSFSGTIICGSNKQQIQEIQFRYTNGFQKQNNLSPSNCNPEIVMTSYTLAVQWPQGVCTGNSGVTCQIKPVPTEFTIHVLWPNPNGAPSTETFNAQQIATLTSQLNTNWPNLKSSQQSVSVNLKFWQDEWVKHGKYSCLGVRAYFEKSLQLHKDDDQGLRAKLAAENIRPTINTYRLVDIQAAVKKINGGFSGTIICSSNRQQIQEIQFRYTNGFQKQNNLSPSNCGPEILFPPQVESYILAVQWPPGVCTGNSGVTCKINPMPAEFTIHGLWPQPNGAPATETFNANQIATLTSDLNKYWPNLKSTQQRVSVNLVFWQDEWKKHGKYSDLGVRAYFEKSLQLHRDAGQGLKAKLAAENIRPTNFNTYRLVDIQAAVKKINGGFSGTVRCVASKAGNVQQIQEICWI